MIIEIAQRPRMVSDMRSFETSCRADDSRRRRCRRPAEFSSIDIQPPAPAGLPGPTKLSRPSSAAKRSSTTVASVQPRSSVHCPNPAELCVTELPILSSRSSADGLPYHCRSLTELQSWGDAASSVQAFDPVSCRLRHRVDFQHLWIGLRIGGQVPMESS